MKLADFWDSLIDIKGNKFYIWGAGNTSSLNLEGLKRENSFSIEGYIDSNINKQGKEFGNKKIISPDEYYNKADNPVLINTTNKEVFRQICSNVSDLGGKYYSYDSLVFSRHKKEIEEVYDLLEDDLSKDTYLCMLNARVNCDQPDESIVDDRQYFCLRDFLIRDPKEVFVDVGAYVGDSTEEYIFRRAGVFDHIYTFEPDSNNYDALSVRLKRLKSEWNIDDSRIGTFKMAVGDRESEAVFETNIGNFGLGSKIIPENNEDGLPKISVTTLDSFFGKKKVSYIKADIESFEYNMLMGGKKVIEMQKPKLAVCIYHNPTDMYSIPLLVKRLNPDYKIKIRQHAYNLDETVLYAY